MLRMGRKAFITGIGAIWLYDRALTEISREWTMAKVAFLGLGVMGFPMAGHLAAKGHDVTVYNRTFAKAEAWTQKHQGKAAKTPKEAAAGHPGDHGKYVHARHQTVRDYCGEKRSRPNR